MAHMWRRFGVLFLTSVWPFVLTGKSKSVIFNTYYKKCFLFLFFFYRRMRRLFFSTSLFFQYLNLQWFCRLSCLMWHYQELSEQRSGRIEQWWWTNFIIILAFCVAEEALTLLLHNIKFINQLLPIFLQIANCQSHKLFINREREKLIFLLICEAVHIRLCFRIIFN